jgi:hypothetical protein
MTENHDLQIFEEFSLDAFVVSYAAYTKNIERYLQNTFTVQQHLKNICMQEETPRNSIYHDLKLDINLHRMK